ncbi:TNF receptor-associated factor 3 [Cytospora mali]|uniref:TNF receptor-associated factor 3 n=1 Tax=Cytospora mali TaxID=578113 RepID=A0A194WC06_CYTMA|nr:TNF receptor-associated factor 3 [Valsa mali]
MPPPNTPNDASGTSSPTSTRQTRRNLEHIASLTQIPSSENFARDIQAILFGTPATPTQTSSGSATPAVSMTSAPALGANLSPQRLPNELSSSRNNMLAPTSPTVSTTPAMAVGTNYNTQGRATLERRRSSLHTMSAPRLSLPVPRGLEHVEISHTPEARETRSRTSPWSPSRSPSPSLASNAQYASSQQPFAPAIDWQCLDYTSQVDENLLCAICKAPFHRPLTTKACGHTFCEACIDQALEEARGRTRDRVPCPLCRTELSTGCDRSSHRFVRVVEIGAQLDQLEVKCPNNAQLCQWKGRRSSLEDHVRNVCEFTLFPCLSDTCDKMIIRKGRSTGSSEGHQLCRHFESACSLCNETIDMSTQIQHLLTTCSGYLAPCGYCGHVTTRQQLAAHEDACANEEMTCTHEKLGCQFKSTRRNITAHEKTCKRGWLKESVHELFEAYMHESLTLMKAEVTRQVQQDMQIEKRRMEVMLQDIREDFHAAIQEEQRKREELTRSLTNINNPEPGALRYSDPVDESSSGPRRPPLPIPAGSDYEQAEYMFRMFDELDSRMSDISKAMIDQDARHSVMLLNELMPVKEQLVEARSQLGVMGMHVRWLMDLQRSRQRQIAEVVSGLTGGSASGSPSSAATSSDAQPDSRRANPGNTGAGSSNESLPGASRRMSDHTSPVRPSL